MISLFRAVRNGEFHSGKAWYVGRMIGLSDSAVRKLARDQRESATGWRVVPVIETNKGSTMRRYIYGAENPCEDTAVGTAAELKDIIAKELDCTEGANRFLAQVRKYSDIRELDAEVIREFVDRIYVHEKKVVNGKKSQEIRILWNCIGEFTPPKAIGK